jgi:hypothetical protein
MRFFRASLQSSSTGRTGVGRVGGSITRRSSVVFYGADDRYQERRLARISILIVWLFIGCHVWKLIPTAFESGYSHDGLSHNNWPDWVLVVQHISHLLITLNSAINFLIYVIM